MIWLWIHTLHRLPPVSRYVWLRVLSVLSFGKILVYKIYSEKGILQNGLFGGVLRLILIGICVHSGILKTVGVRLKQKKNWRICNTIQLSPSKLSKLISWQQTYGIKMYVSMVISNIQQSHIFMIIRMSMVLGM